MPETPDKKIREFTLVFNNKLEIAVDGSQDISKISDAKFAPLAAGINNMTVADNETATTDQYMDGEGFGESDITSKRLQLTLAGHRLEGDAAQDFIASKQLAIGSDLKTLFRWTQPSGDTIAGLVTMTNIVSSGGAPGAKQTFSVVLVFNGKPKFTAGTDNTSKPQ